MPYRYDTQLGEWVYDDPLKKTEVQDAEPPVFTGDPGDQIMQRKQWEQDRLFKDERKAASVVEPERIASYNPITQPVESGKEVLRVLGNAGASLVTDFGDIIAGLGDVAGEAGNAIQGKGFNIDNTFIDADNPWTVARRNMFAPETEVGKMMGTVTRIGVALAFMPKFAFRGLAALPGAVGKVKALGTVAEGAGGLSSFILKAEAFAKGVGVTDKALEMQKSFSALEKSFIKGSPAAKAAGSAARNDWLTMSLSDAAKATAGAPELKGFADWADNAKQGLRGFTQLAAKSSAAEKVRTVGQALAWDAFVAFNVFGEGDREMDATFADSMLDWGLPTIPGLVTEAEDSAWARKSKQMVEGLAIGTALNGLVDTYRAYKFAQAFKAAKPTEQAQILKVFAGASQDIGDSIGRQLAAGVEGGPIMSGGARPRVAPGEPPTVTPPTSLDPWRGTATAPRPGAIESLRTGLDQEVQRALPAAPEPVAPIADPWAPPPAPAPVDGGMVPAGIEPAQVIDLTAPPLQPGAATLPPGSSPEPKPPGAPLAGLLGAGDGGLVAPVQPVQVQDLGPATPRPQTPIVTPQTIKSAFEQDAYRAWQQSQALTFTEAADGSMQSLQKLSEGVRQLMPSNRVDALEYLTRFPIGRNALGVIPASDSVWSNFISQKALAEGWARIDADTMQVFYNRKLAFEIDNSDAVINQAKALDEFDALRSYETTPIDTAESFKVAQQENPLPIDAAQSAKAATAEQAAIDNRGLVDTAAAAVKAADQVDALKASEDIRLTAAERMKLTGRESPQQVVREMLGLNLDEQINATTIKAETSRGWNVIDKNGEQLNDIRFPTKKQADQFAEKENARFQGELTSRARQMAQDGSDVPVTQDVVQSIDNSLTGKLNITEAQGNAIKGMSPELDSLLKQAESIADFGTKKRTFELTQQQLMGLSDVLQKQIDNGLVSGTALRSVRALMNKIDGQMAEMAPKVRAQNAVNELLANTEQFAKHGEFCDYL